MCAAAALSVVIPSLNEASRLPILLADLNRWTSPMDLVVVDGGSNDLTTVCAKLAGARLIQSSRPGRGHQLAEGARVTHGTWLLFLHADSRLPASWCDVVQRVINQRSNHRYAWFFDFRIKDAGPILHVLEMAVALRSHLLQSPYGDQGLLLSRDLYQSIGGYASLPLMEDLDLIERLKKQCACRLKGLGVNLTTDNRRWKYQSVLHRSWQNARLRHRWRKGEPAIKLAETYYR